MSDAGAELKTVRALVVIACLQILTVTSFSSPADSKAGLANLVLSQEDEIPPDWPIVYASSFDQPETDWYTGVDDDAYAEIDRAVVDGGYRWEITPHRDFQSWISAPIDPVSDFYMVVDVHLVSGPRSSGCGIIFRGNSSPNVFYEFSVSELQQFSVYMHRSGSWTSLIDWQESSRIKVGDYNQLAVKAEGDHFTFYINGHQVGRVVDSTLARGEVGLSIEVYDETADGAWVFDNVEVRVPPGVESSSADADSLFQNGDYEGALTAYEEALQLANSRNDLEGAAHVLQAMGEVYLALNDREAALDAQHRAVEMLAEVGDPFNLADANFQIATLYMHKDIYGPSLDFYYAALEGWQDLGEGGQEAETYNRLGIIHSLIGEYDQAREHYDQALRLWEEQDDLLNQSRAINNIGTVYAQLGDHETALTYFQHSLDIALEIDDPWREAIWRSNIGGTYYSLGDLDRALAYFQEANELFLEVGEARRSYEASNLESMAMVYADQGDYQRTRELLSQALNMYREVGDRYSEAGGLYSQGDLYWRSGETEQALQVLNSALEIQQEIGDRSGEAWTLNLIGEIYEELGDDQGALDAYLLSIEVRESIIGDIQAEAHQRALAGLGASVYQRAVRLLVQSGESDHAFEIAERGRARAFLESMGNGRPDIGEGASADLLDREKLLRGELSAVEQYLIQERSYPVAERDEARISSLTEQLEELQGSYEDLLAEIQRESPELSSLFTVPTISVADTQELLDEHTTLLAFYLTDESAVAFVLTKDSFEVVDLVASSEEIAAAVENFRIFAMANLSNPKPRSLEELYGWLIEPIEDRIHTPLVGLIPHQDLHYVPFAALYDGEMHFGERVVLFYLPSMSALPFIQAKGDREFANPLIMGDPEIDNENLPRLKFAAEEVVRISGLFALEAYVGEQATEARLRDEVGSAGVVHLAAHGSYNPGAPLFSRIWLGSGSDHDGRLNVYEIYGLDLASTDLVVLSACDTQLGELSAGDDVVGLNRAFLYGAPSVVASLWPVDDEATGYLMESFYTHMLDGMGKAQALQKAQEEMMEHPDWAHPYYWAAFVLNGDPGPLQESDDLPDAELDITEGSDPSGFNLKSAGYIFAGVILALGLVIAVRTLWRRRRSGSKPL